MSPLPHETLLAPPYNNNSLAAGAFLYTIFLESCISS